MSEELAGVAEASQYIVVVGSAARGPFLPPYTKQARGAEAAQLWDGGPWRQQHIVDDMQAAGSGQRGGEG